MTKKKRKVCFIITNFIHYSRNFLILDELKKRKDVDLHIIIAGTALLPKYSSKGAYVKESLVRDGFKNLYDIHFNLEGSDPTTRAKTAGLGVIEFSSFFNQIKPDVIVARGDRFEVLAAVTAASLMNIPIAHIEGGDVSGTLDEGIRHAITKLSHIHFATNDASKKRIARMGEDPKLIFNVGSPDIEIVQKLAGKKGNDYDVNSPGTGAIVNVKEDYLMVMYHPVTSELDCVSERTHQLLEAVHELDVQVLWFWPNFDAGAEKISHELRMFNNKVENHKIRFMRYIPPQYHLNLLNKTKCLIGNSSAGIKECSYLGVPVVNIGTRQARRLRSDNVLDVSHNKVRIKKAIHSQMEHGRYPVSKIYHANNTSKKIAGKIATVGLYIQKSFKD